MKMLRKLIQDGKVAVLVSPGYGAGWSTWNQGYPEILFDPAMVKLVEQDKKDELRVYVELKYPEICKLGMDDLEVQWVREGKQFRVVEYDGNEGIEYNEEVDWIIA
jgi:hypothetical protein